jgi:hypothetical protein
MLKMTEIFLQQYQIADKLSLLVILQLRKHVHWANGAETGMVNDNFNFFNQGGFKF